MKIGIVYCCYGNPEYIDDCLKPWIEAKKSNDILIAAVHGQFKEYHDLGISDNDEISAQRLRDLGNKLDFLYIQNSPIYSRPPIYQTEAEIRDKGLQWLLEQNCDYIWLLDNDEFYTVEQINSIAQYLEKGDNSFYNWFSIPFKNYIFSGKEYILGFCPPRIFRVNPYGDLSLRLHSFFWDNDAKYQCGDFMWSYQKLASKSIPAVLINGGIKHLTWLHSNGKNKVNYQIKHFGESSYKWNDETNKLEFNPAYHKLHNLPLPEIHYDN